jgi:hypothetical protein
MPSGYRKDGVDFDNIFDPYLQGTKPANTGMRVDGVDLVERYAPIVFGTKAPDVGYRVNGVDVSNLWAAIGTAVYLELVTSEDVSAAGAATSAGISVRVKTNGEIEFIADLGGTVVYHYPTGVGVGSLYQFRISGTVNGSRNPGSSASMTGKGGVSFTAAVIPGNSAGYDTGWQAADDVVDFLTMAAASSGNAGVGSVDGNMQIQIRRVSDSVVIRTLDINFECTADSQL